MKSVFRLGELEKECSGFLVSRKVYVCSTDLPLKSSVPFHLFEKICPQGNGGFAKIDITTTNCLVTVKIAISKAAARVQSP